MHTSHIKRLASRARRSPPNRLLCFTCPQMCSGHQPGGPRGPLGMLVLLATQHFNAFGKRACLWPRMLFCPRSPEQTVCSQPGRHFSFLVSWVLTTVSTDYSQEEAKAITLPRQRQLPLLIHHFPGGREKEPLGKGSLCAVPCSRKMSGPYGNRAFGGKDRIWKKL